MQRSAACEYCLAETGAMSLCLSSSAKETSSCAKAKLERRRPGCAERAAAIRVSSSKGSMCFVLLIGSGGGKRLKGNRVEREGGLIIS